MAPLQKQSLKFCALGMVSPGREFRSPGVGVAEEPLDKLEAGLFPECGVAGRAGGGSLSFLKLFFSVHRQAFPLLSLKAWAEFFCITIQVFVLDNI